MEILAFAEFIFGIVMKYGIPGVKRIMEIWDVDKPTIEQIRELKEMETPDEILGPPPAAEN